MADLSKLKRRSTLGAPPPLEEASQNLTAPETAPAVPDDRSGVSPWQTIDEKKPRPPQSSRLDGRSLRRTGRTLQLATRVSYEFDEKLRLIAQREGLKIVEVLERALAAYEAQKKQAAI